MTEQRELGRRPVLVAHGERTLGLVAVGDPVALYSREAIAGLRAMGFEVRMLSGDHRTAAEAGDVAAMTRLAFLYEDGRGVGPDLNEALKWFRRASDSNSTAAALHLGRMHDDDQ